MELTLKEDDRESISALAIAGGWIEGLFIATQISEQMPNNQEIKSIICQQKYSSKSVLELLKNNALSANTIETVVQPLEEINSSFDDLLPLNDANPLNNSEADNETLLVSDQVISDVRLIIDQIRSDVSH